MPTDGMTIPPFEPDDRRAAGSTGAARATSRERWRRCSSAFARLVRERPAGSASVLLACTVDEEFTHTGSSRLAEIDHGADLAIVAEPTSLDLVHCHKGALRWKIRTSGRRLPQLDAPPGRQRHLPDGPGPRGPRDVRRHAVPARRPTRSSARRACRSAGSRGDRASTSFPTGARSRSTAA